MVRENFDNLIHIIEQPKSKYVKVFGNQMQTFGKENSKKNKRSQFSLVPFIMVTGNCYFK